MTKASADYEPEVRVTYTRLERLHDAWNAFDMPDCRGSKACACRRCVTMDVLTMTHIVERSDIAEGLRAVAAYIDRKCNREPWGLASLMPGKSNFWLSGLLCQRIQPAAVFLTKVDDISPLRPQPWHAYGAKPDSIKHVFVLDDMSYSGTQLANLLRTVKARVGGKVYACPLFVTPHALPVISDAGATVWDGVTTTLANTALYATLGNHRESAARSFDELMAMYAKCCDASGHIEYQKTLTTTIPYYKIPDHFSCPEKAYISPSDCGSTDIKRLRFTRSDDQQPKYKDAASVCQKLRLT